MSEPIARIRIELEDTDPMVWRELDLPLSTTLATLHELIQVAMRWEDSHLHEFVVGEKVYGVPYPEPGLIERKVHQSRSIRLGTLIDRGVREFLYVYDFGDNWRHRIMIGDVRQGDPALEYPHFIAGARRAPPDDVGGISGFEEFLEAVTDPDHEDHERMLTWCGGSFDPDDIDERHVRMIVEDFAARRRGPLKSHRGEGRRRRT